MNGSNQSPRSYKTVLIAATMILLSLVPGINCLIESPVQAQEEQWKLILAGFKSKERQYFDLALDYLAWQKADPHCPISLKKQYDFQVAMTHLDAIEEGAMFLTRDKHLQECREALARFIQENPDSDLAFDAQSILGRLYSAEGNRLVRQSESEMTKDADRESLRNQARENLQKALPYFEAADKIATEKAKKLQDMQKANAAAVKEADLFAAYGRFLIGKIEINRTKMAIAATYPKGSSEFKDGIGAVAKAFEDLAKKYNNYSAGFEAKLNAAKAYKELGNFKTARSLLGELNVLQGDEFLKIRSESLLLALEMNLIEKKPENYLDSINRAKAWSENVPASAKISYDGQRIYLQAAKNFIEYAESVKDKKADYDRAIRDAGIFLRQVRGDLFPPIAKEARTLLEKIGGIKIDKTDPENYQQAKEFADDLWREFVMFYTEFNDIQGKDKENARKKMVQAGDACVRAFNLAINMGLGDIPMSELNAFRQNLIRVYWIQGKTLEAALLADWLTQHYPGQPEAQKTAEMAVQLYRQIFVEEKMAGHDGGPVAERLLQLCNFITEQWKGGDVTGVVQLIQIETAIDNGDLEKARALLNETKAGTPQRVAAELKIGQSLWNRYAEQNRLPEGDDGKPSKEELDGTLLEAKKQLELGLNGKLKLIEKGTVKADSVAVQCALALAQICVNDNESGEAIKWLTHPKLGPLALVEKPDGFSNLELLKNMELSATMVALRAYVADEKLEQAESMMNRLEKVISEQGADEQKLTQIYVSLGRQLEDRLKELNEAGQLEQAEKVADGFELFLTRIKNRGEANSFQSLYWVADTFYRLGSGMSTEKNVPDKAKEYYRKAGGTYVDILQRVAKDDEAEEEANTEVKRWAPERAEATIKTRLAESLRCIGQYEAGMKFLEALLDETESRLDIQIEAAKLLEAWGKSDAQKLTRAVAGGYPSKKVWGWNGLIKRTSTNVDQFAAVYYEAYLSKFRCALELAKQEKDSDKKEKMLNNIDRDMKSLLLMRPQLGGPEWFAQFDQFYKSFERTRTRAGRAGGIKALLKRFEEEQQAAAAAGAPNEDIPEAEKAEKRLAEKKAAEKAERAQKKAAGKSNAKKAAEQAKAAETANSMTLWILLAVTVVCIPVIAFFVFGKKKK